MWEQLVCYAHFVVHGLSDSTVHTFSMFLPINLLTGTTYANWLQAPQLALLFAINFEFS